MVLNGNEEGVLSWVLLPEIGKTLVMQTVKTRALRQSYLELVVF